MDQDMKLSFDQKKLEFDFGKNKKESIELVEKILSSEQETNIPTNIMLAEDIELLEFINSDFIEVYELTEIFYRSPESNIEKQEYESLFEISKSTQSLRNNLYWAAFSLFKQIGQSISRIDHLSTLLTTSNNETFVRCGEIRADRIMRAFKDDGCSSFIIIPLQELKDGFEVKIFKFRLTENGVAYIAQKHEEAQERVCEAMKNFYL